MRGAAVVICTLSAATALAATVETKVALMVRDRPAQAGRAVERVPAHRKLPLIGRSPDRGWVHVMVGKRDGWLPAAQVLGLAKAKIPVEKSEEQAPLASVKPVRPEAWVEASRYHDGAGPERVTIAAARTDLVARPVDGAQVVGMARRGETLSVLRASRDGRWFLVEQGGGEVAWVASAAVKAAGRVPVERPPGVAPATTIAADEPTIPLAPSPITDGNGTGDGNGDGNGNANANGNANGNGNANANGNDSVNWSQIAVETPAPPKPKKRHRAERPTVDETPAAATPSDTDNELVAVAPAAPKRALSGTAGLGVALLGQRFTSNATGFLTNYETSAQALAVDVALAWRQPLGPRWFIGVDGAYRFAGATGVKVAAADGPLTLSWQSHDLDAAASVGAHFAALGGLDLALRLGVRMLLEVLDQNLKALLPSDRFLALAVGARLQAPSLWRDLGARADATLLAPGSLAETGGLGEGDAGGVLGFSVGAAATYRLPHDFSVEAGWRYTALSAHFTGKADRNPAITSADRSSSTHVLTAGVTYTY